ncbi:MULTISPECIES: hypothetical protein [unclassified Curtobacterium]|uniref:hypothetical protein n=1 Tax=unclassified Curtobacterium TaxID=257496 RepID=UPI0038305BCA
MVTPVDWTRLERSEFERIVNVLISREGERQGLVVTAPDGRGGDDGIDIELREPDTGRLVHIYQLKHFPEGFSSGWAKARRPQISKSFRTALQHAPDHWTLVVPEQFTAKEQKFVTTLAVGTAVSAHIVGSVELNKLLVDHADVHEWAVRDAVRDVLSLMSRSDVQPATTTDAAQGLERYVAQQNTFSLYWGRRLAVVDGELVWQIYRKREDAPLMEPLKITMHATFGSEDAELQKLASDVLGYGRSTRLDFPRHIVQSLVLDGPEDWFAGTEHDVAVSIIPAYSAADSQPARVEAYDSKGILLGALTGRTINSNAGHAGAFVEVRFEDVLTMLWRVPREGTTGSTDVTLEAVGRPAAAVARVTRFLQCFRHTDRLRLEVAGRPLIAQVNAADSGMIDDHLHEYADDLGVIERLADVSLPFPDVTPELDERIWTRVTRMMLEGRCALIHNYRGMNATLNGSRDGAMDQLLAEGASILNASTDGGGDVGSVELLGVHVPIEGMCVWHPQMRIVDADEVRARLDSGTAQGMRVLMQPADGTPFRAYSAHYMAATGVVVPEPWNIPGISEHPALAGIRDAANLAQD